MRRLLPFLILAVLLVPASAGAAVATHRFTVTWEGHGQMHRGQHQTVEGPNCEIDRVAVDSSTFSWKVTWKNVKLHPGAAHDGITRAKSRELNPKASLSGHYTSQTKVTNSCGPPALEKCGPKKVSFSGAGNPKEQALEITPTKGRDGRYHVFVDAETGVSGGAQCANDAEFGGIVGGFYWSNFLYEEPPTPNDPGALSGLVLVPRAVVHGHGKVIDILKSDGEHVPPGREKNCSLEASTHCHVGQDWEGSLTFRRTG